MSGRLRTAIVVLTLLLTGCSDIRPLAGMPNDAAPNSDVVLAQNDQSDSSSDAPSTDKPAEERRESAVSEMGPDGTHWPSHTPRYTAPATTRIETLGDLNDALSEAQSGDIIEISPHTWHEDLTISAGNRKWAKNVLVRPRLGRRQSVTVEGQIVHDAPHVTIAGFQLNDTWRAKSDAERSAYARIVVGANVAGAIWDTRDFGIYEMVAPDYGFSGDRIQIKAHGDSSNVNTTISGVWLKGKFRRIGAGDHADTVQTFSLGSGAVVGMKLVDSVLWTSADKTLQGGDLRDLVVRNTYLGECSTNPEEPPSGLECPGHHAIRDSGVGVEMYDVIVSGSIANDVAYEAMHGTKAQKIDIPSANARGNTIDATFVQNPPKLANLDSIWD